MEPAIPTASFIWLHLYLLRLALRKLGNAARQANRKQSRPCDE
jgi:hypothetical protein